MEEPIDEAYFNWLCAKVLSVRVPIYWGLMKILYRTEFIWTIPGDRNRCEDGIELRDDYLRVSRDESDSLWYDQPCSVLEMLIALAQRAQFQTDQPAKDWFWIFMQNLNLDEYRQVGQEDVSHIENVLHELVWRSYDSSGYGGIFPMRWPKRDQTKVELWYQLFEYLDEQGMM